MIHAQALATHFIRQRSMVGGAASYHQHLPAPQDLVEVVAHSPEHHLKVEADDHFTIPYYVMLGAFHL